MWTYAFNFLRFIPRSGVAGSYGDSMFSLLRNCQTLFHGNWIILRSYRQCRRVPTPHPHQHLSIFVFLMIDILVGMKWKPLFYRQENRGSARGTHLLSVKTQLLRLEGREGRGWVTGRTGQTSSKKFSPNGNQRPGWKILGQRSILSSFLVQAEAPMESSVGTQTEPPYMPP